MKSSIIHRLIPSLVLASALASTSLATEAQPAAAMPVTAERSMLVTVVATVVTINLPTREVTLQGENGSLVTLTVGDVVKRLNEVKVGDVVSVDYYVSLAGEVRAATDAEKANPLVVAEAVAKASADTAPAAGALRTIKAVMTATAVDVPNLALTLEGPNGNSVTLPVKAEKLAQVHVGDTIVITYTEALAVSLNPVAPAVEKKN